MEQVQQVERADHQALTNPAPSDEMGTGYRIRSGDTWAAVALRKYGDAMLGGPLAEHNGASASSKPEVGTQIALPPPEILNRRMNVLQPARNMFSTAPVGRHILPSRDAATAAAVEENSIVRDARTRMLRAAAGMGLRARGGGWKPVSSNRPEDAPGAKKKKRNLPEPKLEDRWLRRLARLTPRSCMKVSRDAEVGTGPVLAMMGGLREAENSAERMELIERFLQAYGSEGHKTVKRLLRAVAQ